MGILQTRILEWVAMPSSRGSFQPRGWTQVSHIAGGFFTIWGIKDARTFLVFSINHFSRFFFFYLHILTCQSLVLLILWHWFPGMGLLGHRIYVLNFKESGRLYYKTIIIIYFSTDSIWRNPSLFPIFHQLIIPGISTLPNVVSVMDIEWFFTLNVICLFEHILYFLATWIWSSMSCPLIT